MVEWWNDGITIMKEKITVVEGLVNELCKEEKQTPYLHAAIGGLRTFLEKAPQHVTELQKAEAAKATKAQAKAT